MQRLETKIECNRLEPVSVFHMFLAHIFILEVDVIERRQYAHWTSILWLKQKRTPYTHTHIEISLARMKIPPEKYMKVMSSSQIHWKGKLHKFSAHLIQMKIIEWNKKPHSLDRMISTWNEVNRMKGEAQLSHEWVWRILHSSLCLRLYISVLEKMWSKLWHLSTFFGYCNFLLPLLH